jgi:DNA-binding PadR family transcriptional regulator
MNLTRLMVLGTLSRYGAQHGHQIRRIAEVTNVGEWGGVSVGALYRELRGMEREGLVEAVRTEKVGNRPARTVYEITAEGRLELMTVREQAIRQLVFGPDPLGVAVHFATHDMDPAELRQMLRARRDRLAITGTEVAADLERLTARGVHDALTGAIMRRAVLLIEAEVRWHDELDAVLANQACGHAVPAAVERTGTRAALVRAAAVQYDSEQATDERGSGGQAAGEDADSGDADGD